MSKKSRKKEKKAPASSEAAIDATAKQEPLTHGLGEKSESLHETITDTASDADSADSNDTEVMEKSGTPEELEVSIDLYDSALPEAVTEEALSGDVPVGEIPRLSHIIEAILFASQKAVTPKELVAHLKSAAAAEPTSVASAFARIKEVNLHEALVELQAEVAASGRAYQVRETATGWLLTSAPGFAPWLRALYPEAKPTRLSPSALETLAIIAYRQPIARADMEAVRGVSVDGVMQTLLDRGLVKISGRAEVAGRPLLYATTQYFLDHFGLRHLDELPNAAELRQVQLPKATPEPTESDADAASETDPELPGDLTEGTSEAEKASSQESSLDEEASGVLEEVEVTEILELREAVVFSEVTFDSDTEQENASATSEGEERSDDQTDSSEEEPEHPHS